MDTVNKATRSKIMRSVPQRGTTPEIRLRKALHRRGFRYRINDKRLPGSPDIVFPKYHAVIFVHGCFWHRHGCKYTTTPSTRKEFWAAKFKANVERDKRNEEKLRELGWRVLVIWECEIKKLFDNGLIERVERFLLGKG
jgi:DNA mismatch endonuclease (patch repair protein)